MSKSREATDRPTNYDTLEEYADKNSDDLMRVLRHASDNFARGCALTALVHGSDRPELQKVIEILEEEVE
jgi:hypothetical protein